MPHKPFLVSTGNWPSHQMRAGRSALSQSWGGDLIQFSCSSSPKQVLNCLPNEEGLVQLVGDPALLIPDEGSWLEALAAWRQPTLLMVSPLDTGDIPGMAAAYVALCKVLSVPLIGILQIGGTWRQHDRRLDGLPWCGCLAGDYQADDKSQHIFVPTDDTNLEHVVSIARSRFYKLMDN